MSYVPAYIDSTIKTANSKIIQPKNSVLEFH